MRILHPILKFILKYIGKICTSLTYPTVLCDGMATWLFCLKFYTFKYYCDSFGFSALFKRSEFFSWNDYSRELKYFSLINTFINWRDVTCNDKIVARLFCIDEYSITRHMGTSWRRHFLSKSQDSFSKGYNFTLILKQFCSLYCSW